MLPKLMRKYNYLGDKQSFIEALINDDTKQRMACIDTVASVHNNQSYKSWKTMEVIYVETMEDFLKPPQPPNNILKHTEENFLSLLATNKVFYGEYVSLSINIYGLPQHLLLHII